MRVTLTIEVNEEVWGADEMLSDFPDWDYERQRKECIALFHEDIGAFLEDAVWTVDLTKKGPFGP